MLESLAVNQPPILPAHRQILATQPAPPGWIACYVASIERDIKEADVIRIPIILWATVRFEEDGEDYEEVRHFIADSEGGIMDFMDLEFPFLCVVEPSGDFDKITRAALAEYNAEQQRKETRDSFIS
jgi:hypothetical protein